MEKFITKSRGQGNLFSKLRTGVSNKWSSIVTKLGSRAFTGRGLHINVHQHFGYKLHLFCNHNSSERCVEGRSWCMLMSLGSVPNSRTVHWRDCALVWGRGTYRSWRTKLKNVLYRPRYRRIATGQCLSQQLNHGKNTRPHLNVVVL